MVAVEALRLMTWQELELRVCGRVTVDLDLLREMTVYRTGFTPSTPVVNYFWEALHRATEEQRAAFLRFVWGRSRLPLTAAEFPRSFAMQPRTVPEHSDPDRALPVAHTCFLSIDIPPWTSADVAFERLMYAVENSFAIDSDQIATPPAADWTGGQ